MINGIDEHFTQPLGSRWDVAEVGGGTVRVGGGVVTMTIQPSRDRYSNAQIDDYHHDGFRFRWRPPLRLTVIAQASAPAEALRGTAGFGFWNHPFSPDAHRLPRLPQAIWFFFASPPSNMALAYSVPGFGWKAATIDSTRPGAIAMTPLALPAALLMRAPSLYARLYPYIQRRLNIAERLLDGGLLAERHRYTIEWRSEGALFAVDGEPVLETPYAPRGAAGFVAWMDNRYAVVTPQGSFGFGIVSAEREQSIMLEQVTIERL
jgi:hypothetical protein